MRDITFTPIGVVRSPFTQQQGTPIQPACADGAAGSLEVEPQYAAALTDLEGFERIWIIYHLDRAGPYRPMVVPYRDDKEHGLFATRSPSRPNAIGISVVRLTSIRGTRVDVEGLDVLDGTPLLDIKPYVPEFDAFASSRSGWFETSRVKRTTADRRFEQKESSEQNVNAGKAGDEKK
jgi:tRNA (adenine37-N6)-methyltransferase